MWVDYFCVCIWSRYLAIRVGGNFSVFDFLYSLTIFGTGPGHGSRFDIMHGAVGGIFTHVSTIGFANGYALVDIWEGRTNGWMNSDESSD